MRKILAFAVLAVLVAPVARAQEVQLGVAGSVEYDDNVFNSDTVKLSDYVVRVGPILELRRKEGTFVYDVRYEPRFETFVDGTAEDAWDHAALGRVTWQLSPRTSIGVTDRFNITRNLSRAGFIVDPSAPDVGPTPQIDVARQRIKRNFTAVSLDHTFTSRLSSTASFTYDIFRTNRQDRYDSDVAAGNLNGTYVLSPRDRVGAGFGVTYQDFLQTDTQPGRQTYFYRLTATWFHTFDPTFTISAQVGPTFVDSNQTTSAPAQGVVPAYPFVTTDTGGIRFIDSTTCPTTSDGQPYVLPGDTVDTCGAFPTELTGATARLARNRMRIVSQADQVGGANLRTTIFADIQVQKRWEHFRALASFKRSDSTSSGIGQSTVLNLLNGTLIWEPTDRWRMRVGASWALRESATNQTANGIGLGPPTNLLFLTALNQTPVMATASPSVNLRVVDSNNFVNVTTYTVRARLSRFIGKQSQVFINYTYLNQSFDGTTLTRSFENHRVMVGFRLLLDWMRL